MTSTKTWLQMRKKELLAALEPYESMKLELKQVEKALAALEPKKSDKDEWLCPGGARGCPTGCHVCRTGPNYR